MLHCGYLPMYIVAAIVAIAITAVSIFQNKLRLYLSRISMAADVKYTSVFSSILSSENAMYIIGSVEIDICKSK